MVGDCSKSCGVGIRNRSRTKIKEDLFGGQPCVGEKNVDEDCNLEVCPGKFFGHEFSTISKIELIIIIPPTIEIF